jgi:hypothetical protein
VRLLGEGGEVGLRQRLVLDAQLHRNAEAAAVARADRHGAGDLRLRRVALLLLGDVVERAAEAGRVARGEEVLGRGGAGLARPAHFLRHREIGLDGAVAGFGMSVTSAVAVAVAVKRGLMRSMEDPFRKSGSDPKIREPRRIGV